MHSLLIHYYSLLSVSSSAGWEKLVELKALIASNFLCSLWQAAIFSPFQPHTGKERPCHSSAILLTNRGRLQNRPSALHYRIVQAVMIDKSGNSDTRPKLLSGSGSLEMKSDGLSLGLPAYDFGMAAGGGKQAHLWRGRGWQYATCSIIAPSAQGINRGMFIMRLCCRASDGAELRECERTHLVCMLTL